MPKLRMISAACLLTLSALYGQAWAKAERVISVLPSATQAVFVLEPHHETQQKLG